MQVVGRAELGFVAGAERPCATEVATLERLI